MTRKTSGGPIRSHPPDASTLISGSRMFRRLLLKSSLNVSHTSGRTYSPHSPAAKDRRPCLQPLALSRDPLDKNKTPQPKQPQSLPRSCPNTPGGRGYSPANTRPKMVHFPLGATASAATLILIAIFVSPTPAAAQM